jgi:hypothetical protein
VAEESRLSCSACGKRIGKAAAYCSSCGAPGPAATYFQRANYERANAARPLEQDATVQVQSVAPGPPPAPIRQHYPPHRAVGQIVGMFSAVGGGLAVASLLFLWATDFFTPVSNAEDFGRALTGAVSLGGVFIFAILIGVVLAAVGGLIAANASSSRGRTIEVAAIGAVLGHLGLVVVLGVLLFLGMELLTEEEAQSTTVETRSAQEIADCVETFGADSEICQPPVVEESGSDELASVEGMVPLLVGLVPAGVVGALSGAILFRRQQVTA